MVHRRIAVAPDPIAAVADHLTAAQLLYLRAYRAAGATHLTDGETTGRDQPRAAPPVRLVAAEGDQPGYSGIGHRQGEMPVGRHAAHIQRLDFQHAGLGCQPMRDLMERKSIGPVEFMIAAFPAVAPLCPGPDYVGSPESLAARCLPRARVRAGSNVLSSSR